MAVAVSGVEILHRSQKAYRALRSYVGATRVTSTAVFPTNTLVQQSVARVTFVRPNRIRIEGRTTPIQPQDPGSGTPFAVISDGKRVWLSWALDANGAFKPVANVEEAMERMAGVTQGAVQTVPSVLLGLPGQYPGGDRVNKPLLDYFADGAVLAGREELHGHPCYRVVGKRPFGTWTFWVDAKTYLLRQLEYHQDNAQIRAFTASRLSAIVERTNREIFEQSAVNGPVGESAFHVPRR